MDSPTEPDVTPFRAWWAENDNSSQPSRFGTATESDLGDGDTTIRVLYSGVNYKDAMALTGRPGIVKTSPLIPGIDLVGEITSTSSPDYRAGDLVLLNGTGIGEKRNGGLAERARVDARHLVRVPGSLGARRAAAIGTAGYTAMLSVLAVERHGTTPADGEILVTGAAGGVGSIAIALLSRLGYTVTASTGRADEHADYLTRLGATTIIDRAELNEAGKPLRSQRWAAVVDAVGSHTLANAIAGLRYGGIATACGLAQGADLPLTVMPFILRGITLAGINSVETPQPLRQEAWNRLAVDLDPRHVDAISHSIPLAEAGNTAGDVLAGKVRGRTVVDVTA
jgi:acrylyl-CoA reductase (NADPH)